MERIGAAEFREQCLALLDNLTPEGVIITKHGRPVARVTPYPRQPADMIGMLTGKVVINGDILSTGEAWDADAQYRDHDGAPRAERPTCAEHRGCDRGDPGLQGGECEPHRRPASGVGVRKR